LLLLGPAGLLLGVLTVRMASEALQIRRSEYELAATETLQDTQPESDDEIEPI
jgi:hypothetical protein